VERPHIVNITFLQLTFVAVAPVSFEVLQAGQDILLRRSPTQNDQLGPDPLLPVVFHVYSLRWNNPPVMCMIVINLRRFGNREAVASVTLSIWIILLDAACIFG
jgi:hypothetical protein